MKNPLLPSLEETLPRTTLTDEALGTQKLAENARALQLLVVALLSAALGMCLLEIAAAVFVGVYAALAAALVVAALALFLGLSWEAWETAYCNRLLDGKGCRDILGWSKENAKVLRYVRSVQAQRRSFCIADHVLLQEWAQQAQAREQAEVARQAEDQALQTLHQDEDPLRS